MKLAKDKISFKIRLAAFQASGDPEPLNPYRILYLKFQQA